MSMCYLVPMKDIDHTFLSQPQSDEFASEHDECSDLGTFASEPANEEGGEWGGDDASEFDGERDEPWDGFRSDAEADADTLASAGYGTDEDYGYYGGSDEY